MDFRVNLFLVFIFFATLVQAQDFSELIPDREFTHYPLPDSTYRASSFNMVGEVQVAVPIRQGIYNANLGLWTILPGSHVMSYCSTGSKDYYLRSDTLGNYLSLLSLEDTILTELGTINFGNFKLKTVINSEDIIIYGQDLQGSKIYRFRDGEITKIAEHEVPIYDLVSMEDQILFVSEKSVYSVDNEAPVELLDLGVTLTGLSYGPSKTYFLSTVAGVFWIDSFTDKKPQLITKVLNGVVHYQFDTLFLLDYMTNSIFRIEFKEK